MSNSSGCRIKGVYDQGGNLLTDGNTNKCVEYCETCASGDDYTGAQLISNKFQQHSDRLTVVKQLGEKNSDDPNSLMEFIVWGVSDDVYGCYQNKVEKNNDLKIVLTYSSHGAGPFGMGHDSGNYEMGGSEGNKMENEIVVVQNKSRCSV